jgi:predicted  nucleic acid-binding Zn-ribbon protein
MSFAKEVALDPDLVTLLALQERDQAVSALEAERNSLDPELAGLDAEIAKAESALAGAHQGVAEAGDRRVELEGKIEGYRLMQEKRRQRLEWVRGAKEAATLMAELDLARSVLAKEEAEWIRSADKVEEAEKRVADVERAVEETRAAQAPRREQIAALQAECMERLNAARAEREEAARQVKKPTLSRYDRIRKGNTPLALYPLKSAACGFCYTAVPIHRRQEIQGGRGLTTCEGCGVLIYDPGT